MITTLLDHANIIEYTKRPFKSLEHMNRELVRRWNETVIPGDTVIYLGDFCFHNPERGHKYWDERLNGNKVYLQGNHDSHKDAPVLSCVIKYGGIDWWCGHYPEQRYRHNLCGHVHNLWRIQRKGRDVIVNCGVDMWGYAPVSMEEILRAVRDTQ